MSRKAKQWLKAAGVRAVKTMAQTGVASIGTAVMLNDVEWLRVISTVLLAGILSALTSLAGLPELQMEQEEKG
ncbi:MAG: hypothetical protein HFI57_07970 [Lachnospiraceae bacterium]|nr:hypothetical protein [Lachnospiraceae bacterium]